VRAFRRIDAHAADRIDHAGVVVFVVMSGMMAVVMSAAAA
jgi:hypothetical protein